MAGVCLPGGTVLNSVYTQNQQETVSCTTTIAPLNVIDKILKCNYLLFNMIEELY